MPCGGGKSLVFAATLWCKVCVGILVEPLTAIAATMAPYLRKRGIRVMNLAAETRQDVIRELGSFRLGKELSFFSTSPSEVLDFGSPLSPWNLALETGQPPPPH